MLQRLILLAIVASLCAIISGAEDDNSEERKTRVFEPSHQPVYVMEGGTFELKCVQENCRTITWQRGSENIDAIRGSDFEVLNYEDPPTQGQRCRKYSTLKKVRAKVSDSQSYQCTPDDNSAAFIVFVVIFSITPINDTMVYNKPATLECRVSEELSRNIAESPMEWWHDGKKLETDGTRYTSSSENDTFLVINKAHEEDAGEYVCRFELQNKQNYSQTVHLWADPFVNTFSSASKNLVQGEDLTLKCDAWGHPPPVVSWEKDGKPFSEWSSARIYVEDNDDIVNGTLKIDDLVEEDRAQYTCFAGDSMNNRTANATILVRVKDKLAALWPFLGICIEVIILCVIIFIYEKRRAKKMAKEDNTEEAEKMNSHDRKGNDDVRHRK